MAKKTPKSEISIFSNYCDDCCPFDEAKAYCIERHLEENPEDRSTGKGLSPGGTSGKEPQCKR